MPHVEELTELIEPVVERAGAELVDLEISGQRGKPVIRVYVDTADGITLDACAEISRSIEAVVEGAEIVPDRYVLEVSSPGIDRRLRKRSHFERYAGSDVDVRLYSAREGRKRFTGRLERISDDPEHGAQIVVRDPSDPDGPGWTFGLNEVAVARLHVNWDSEMNRVR